MNARRKAVHSGMLVFAANVAEIFASTLRNIILARLLSVEDFGIAATFTLLASMLDFAGQMGLSRMAVQARDHDDPRLQATLHSVQAGLGILAGIAVLLVAWPYASLMTSTGLTWAYATLALVPLMRGFMHLDSHRLQRHGRFGPWAIRQIVPPMISLVVIYPAFFWLGDYRAALVSILVQQTGLLAATFVGAERSFQFAGDRAIARRALAFGAPMMLNALLMYFIMNGDRLIIANQFGIASLGWFSAAVTLTLMPINFVAKTAQTALLPTLSKHQDDGPILQRHYDHLVAGASLITVLFTAGVALFGWLVLRLVFSAKFEPADPFLLLLGFAQGIRLMRAVPALIAMAKAETTNPLYSNLARGFFIFIALLVAIMTGNIYMMLMIGIAGEVIATIVAIWLLQRNLAVSGRNGYLALLTCVLLCCVICGVELANWPLWTLLPAALPFLFMASKLGVGQWPYLLRARAG